MSRPRRALGGSASWPTSRNGPGGAQEGCGGGRASPAGGPRLPRVGAGPASARSGPDPGAQGGIGGRLLARPVEGHRAEVQGLPDSKGHTQRARPSFLPSAAQPPCGPIGATSSVARSSSRRSPHDPSSDEATSTTNRGGAMASPITWADREEVRAFYAGWSDALLEKAYGRCWSSTRTTRS